MSNASNDDLTKWVKKNEDPTRFYKAKEAMVFGASHFDDGVRIKPKKKPTGNCEVCGTKIIGRSKKKLRCARCER